MWYGIRAQTFNAKVDGLRADSGPIRHARHQMDPRQRQCLRRCAEAARLEPLSPSLLAIDEQRRAAILASEQAQARRNAASKEIGDAKKAKDDARAAVLMAEVAELKTTMPALDAATRAADEELAAALAAIPNLRRTTCRRDRRAWQRAAAHLRRGAQLRIRAETA